MHARRYFIPTIRSLLRNYTKAASRKYMSMYQFFISLLTYYDLKNDHVNYRSKNCFSKFSLFVEYVHLIKITQNIFKLRSVIIVRPNVFVK